MNTGRRALLVSASLALLASSRPSCEEVIALSGQTRVEASYRDAAGSAFVSSGEAPDYSAKAVAELRAESPSGSDRRAGFAFEASLALDPVAAATSFRVSELWAEWRPFAALSFRAGRQRFGFGSGYGWNPSNDLDPPRNPRDPAASRIGADALQASLDASSFAGLPLSLSLVALPPAFASGVDLSDSRLGARAYAYLGEIELMAVASASRLGEEDFPWLAGGWATAPLGPLVLGFEGSARKRDDYYRVGEGGSAVLDRGTYAAFAGTISFRSGDWLAVAEAYYDEAAYSRSDWDLIESSAPLARTAWLPALASLGSVGPWHGLATLSWSTGDLSASAGAIADLETGATLLSGSFGLSIGGLASAKLELSAPLGPVEDDELGISGTLWTAGASLAVYF